MNRCLQVVAGALVCLCAAASEGKWTPEQVLELGRAALAREGLAMPPERLWNPKTGEGLLSAVISTGGCSAAFISPTGLFLTNHHCLFGILQEHSTPANDIITKGFLAANPDAELRSKTTRVTIPHRFTDVTAEVRAAVPANAGDLDRYTAIESIEKELVAGCERQPGHRCRVAAYDGGVSYRLVDSMELADVRLVWAPARGIGEFGGEIDNFAWPRHAGDFAIGRAYVNGAPYRPAHWLKIAQSGVKPGDFVMLMGYPGTTFRSMTAAEMLERKRNFERRVELSGEVIRIIEETTAGKPDGEIALAARLKSLANRYKNAQGQLLGIARGHLIEKQSNAEKAVAEWAQSKPAHAGALRARDELRQMAEMLTAARERDSVLEMIPSGPVALYLATTLVRAAMEREKPDAERDPDYMDRELARLGDRLEREQKNYYEPTDRALMSWFVRRARQTADVDALYRETRVLDAAERRKMFHEPVAQLRARHDPLLDFAFAVAPQQIAARERDKTALGTVARLRPVWRAAVMGLAAKPVAPDANSTLRITLAHVQGYSPRDAVFYTPQSTLSGLIEKHTGKEPFNAPANVLQAAAARELGRWTDAALKDVPVDFLSDADTTGGNSGSPVVNAKGELVGVNFDRVWENVANDFGYNPAIARNVTTDGRFIWWMLEKVWKGEWLIQELGLK